MDTNLVAQLLQAMKSQPSPVPVTFLITTIVVGSFSAILAAIAVWIQAKAAAVNASASKGIAESTAISVEKVHTAVNSERETMLRELKRLRKIRCVHSYRF